MYELSWILFTTRRTLWGQSLAKVITAKTYAHLRTYDIFCFCPFNSLMVTFRGSQVPSPCMH